MAKFKTQLRRKYQRKQVKPEVKVYDLSVCVSMDGVTRNVVCEVGNELVNMRICQSYDVEWNGQNDLWLYDVDLAFVPLTELSRTLAHLLDMFDYEVEDILI